MTSNPRHARAALEWLKTQPGFQDLASQSDRLARLQADIDRCAPVKGLLVTGYDGTVLLLSTHNPAVAAKTRQFEPTLLAGLTRVGWKVSRIRIRPQPDRLRTAAPDPTHVARTPVPGEAVRAFETLCEQVEPGALRDALAELVRHHRSGRGGPARGHE